MESGGGFTDHPLSSLHLPAAFRRWSERARGAPKRRNAVPHCGHATCQARGNGDNATMWPTPARAAGMAICHVAGSVGPVRHVS